MFLLTVGDSHLGVVGPGRDALLFFLDQRVEEVPEEDDHQGHAHPAHHCGHTPDQDKDNIAAGGVAILQKEETKVSCDDDDGELQIDGGLSLLHKATIL